MLGIQVFSTVAGDQEVAADRGTTSLFCWVIQSLSTNKRHLATPIPTIRHLNHLFNGTFALYKPCKECFHEIIIQDVPWFLRFDTEHFSPLLRCVCSLCQVKVVVM